MKSLLYLTADGLLQPLGFSQVVRVVEGLAKRGWPYRLFSLERAGDLSNEARVRSVRRRLADAGVEWKFGTWHEGAGGRSALENELAMIRAATDTRDVAGIHARAYHSAVAAFARHTTQQTPYLFDTRSYWFDERLEEGRWFTTPMKLAIARGVEHQLFAQAAGVVTLTELQANDVRDGRFGPSRHRAVQCITTCADFNDFTRRPIDQLNRVPEELRHSLKGKRVIGIIGSINRSYLVDETLNLCRMALERSADTHLLVLSVQQKEYSERLKALGIAEDRFTVTRAEHDAMPQWLSLIHWSPLLLQPDSPAKRASMPTKLAEFLACGVRPVHYGCNSEVAEWVRKTGSGVVLNDVSEKSLQAAAEVMAKAPLIAETLKTAREVAAPHFSLEAGLQKYEAVLSAVFPDVRR